MFHFIGFYLFIFFLSGGHLFVKRIWSPVLVFDSVERWTPATGGHRPPRKASASSGQASYPSPRRKRQVSLTPLFLLPPQKLGTAFAGTPVYGGLFGTTRFPSCAAAADMILTLRLHD